MSSRRAQKAAALKALRDRRSGLAGAPDSTRTDDYEFQYEGDVYDVVAEEDYEDLVEKRRQREDFVVDDGACMHCILFSPCFHFVSLSIASASASIACPKPPFIISLANELIPSQHIPTISHPIVSQHILFHSIPFHSIPSHPISRCRRPWLSRRRRGALRGRGRRDAVRKGQVQEVGGQR